MKIRAIKRNTLIVLATLSFSSVGFSIVGLTPIADEEYQPPSEIGFDDFSPADQAAIPPALKFQNAAGVTQLKTINTINDELVETAIDPRFGQINPRLKTIETDATGVHRVVNAPPRSGTFYNRTDVSASVPLNIITSVLDVIQVNVAAPTNANGGLSKGSKLSMAINPIVNPFTEIPVMTGTTRTTQDSLKLNIQATCFPTNLRSVTNPVSPNAIIKLKGKYSINGTPSVTNQDFSVEFPASAVMMGTGQTLTLGNATYPVTFSGFSTPVLSGVSGNLVSVKLPSVTQASINMNTGTIEQAQNSFHISDVQFEQTVPAAPTPDQLAVITSYANYQIAAAAYAAQNGAAYWITYQAWKQTIINQTYMGVSGPIGAPITANISQNTAGINVSQSSDGKIINVTASLPGDLTMCGGYYSPLMVFFDKDRPSFENVTDFKMKHDSKTYWPESNHAGYFLGLLNKNGKIESHLDLFGESENIANGFESLAQYDSNHDGIINKKDAIFKKLVLWKDKKGLGQFNKKDIVYLHKKIKSINLNYKNNFEMASLGAEYRQRSTFDFIKNGKIKTGEIVDVWFKPFLNPENKKVATNNHGK